MIILNLNMIRTKSLQFISRFFTQQGKEDIWSTSEFNRQTKAVVFMDVSQFGVYFCKISMGWETLARCNRRHQDDIALFRRPKISINFHLCK